MPKKVHTSPELQDERLKQAEQKINAKKAQIERIDACLKALPPEYQTMVKDSLRDAAAIGDLLHDMKHVEAGCPVSPEDQLLLGRALRRHLNQVMQVRKEADALQRQMHDILNDTDLDMAA